MNKYLLDTNIIIYAMKGKYPGIKDYFLRIHPSDIFIPSIVIAEIEYGCSKSNNYIANIAKYSAFLEPFVVLPFEKKDSAVYGRIRSTLEKNGQVIGGNDMLIAAIALSNDLVLVTNNTGEFNRIPDLKLEDWTK